MKTVKTVIAGTLFTLATAYAGLLYLELPPEYPASMVENATPEDEAILLQFIKSKLVTLDNEYADRVVILTKDGEAVYRREDGETDGGPYLGDIDFARGSGWIDRVWADVQWHLYEAGEHATCWHADVPTGVYIYRLQAGDKVAVKKVVVAK